MLADMSVRMSVSPVFRSLSTSSLTVSTPVGANVFLGRQRMSQKDSGAFKVQSQERLVYASSSSTQWRSTSSGRCAAHVHQSERRLRFLKFVRKWCVKLKSGLGRVDADLSSPSALWTNSCYCVRINVRRIFKVTGTRR